jgi:hypothetical protein
MCRSDKRKKKQQQQFEAFVLGSSRDSVNYTFPNSEQKPAKSTEIR